jgi:hypothetical protein
MLLQAFIACVGVTPTVFGTRARREMRGGCVAAEGDFDV